jgi:tetratricopeptide (TPR) repeat protein
LYDFGRVDGAGRIAFGANRIHLIYSLSIRVSRRARAAIQFFDMNRATHRGLYLLRGRARLAFAIWLLLCAAGLSQPLRGVQSPRALFSQGVQAYAVEDYEGAIRLLEQAIAAEPAVSEYYQWLGKAAGRRAERSNILKAPGLARKARLAFEKAVELDRTNVGALNDLLDYYLEAPSALGGGEEKASAIASRLGAIDAAEGSRADGLIAVKRRDYARAEAGFRRALDLQPRNTGRLLDLASFLARRGRHAEADALFCRAASADPNSPGLLFAWGKELGISGRDPQRARELLARYLQSERRPDDPPPSEVRNILKKFVDRAGA